MLSQMQETEEAFDSMSYDARQLVTFSVFRNFSGTVWTKPSLWKMMGILLMIAFATASIVVVFTKDPAKLDVGRFSRISSFLEVVVGLLLGFFLSSSVQRWYNCNLSLQRHPVFSTLYTQKLRAVTFYCVGFGATACRYCLDRN